jgi:hypothetical protein
MHPTLPIAASLDAMAWLSGRWTGQDGTDLALDRERATFAARAQTRWMVYTRESADVMLVSFATEAGPTGDEFRFTRG